MEVSDLDPDVRGQRPWNAGNMIGANHPLKLRDVWAIRFFLDERRRLRNRATFDLAINSKLLGCDIVKMKIRTIVAGGALRTRATVIQQKTHRPVQFELMTDARETLLTWLARRGAALADFIFPSRVTFIRHPSTRQYARLVDEWVGAVGWNIAAYGTHSMQRKKHRSSTRRPPTCGPSKFCPVTPTSKTPCAASESISMMRCRLPSGLRFEHLASIVLCNCRGRLFV